jgi:hypothetical protein
MVNIVKLEVELAKELEQEFENTFDHEEWLMCMRIIRRPILTY